jgi:adenylate cyclase class 2
MLFHHTKREIEIKLPLTGAEHGRGLLRSAGFRVVRKRVLEINEVYDTPRGDLKRSGILLRLRQAGRVSTLTVKKPLAGSRYKSRHEVETPVSDFGACAELLHCLGYKTAFRYEKYRTEYSKPGAKGLAMLDETPIGVFLELEGPPSWIDRTARQLGFGARDYITLTYMDLHLKAYRSKGLLRSRMVFAR